MRKTKVIFFMQLFLLIMGCSLPVKEYGSESQETGEIILSNEMFKKTDNDTLFFTINNKTYIRNTGYTFWCEKYNNSSEDFESVKCFARKTSGDSRAGFGVIFCSTTLVNGDNYLLTVLINNEQKYNIGKVINGKFETLSNGWKKCIYLNHGSSFENLIEVEYMKSGENIAKFELKLNGTVIEYFSDSDYFVPNFKGSKSGYVATISAYEDFDHSDINISFVKK